MDDLHFRVLRQLHYSYCGGPQSGYAPGGWTSIPQLAANLLVSIPQLAGPIFALTRDGRIRLEAGRPEAITNVIRPEEASGAILSQKNTRVMIIEAGIAAYLRECSRRDYNGSLASLVEANTYECAAVFLDLIDHSSLPAEKATPVQDSFRAFAGGLAVELGGGEFDTKGDAILYLFVGSFQAHRAMSFCLETLGGFPPRSLRFGIPNEVRIRALVDFGPVVWRHDRGTIHADILNWVCKSEAKAKSDIPIRDRSHIIISERALPQVGVLNRNRAQATSMGSESVGLITC